VSRRWVPVARVIGPALAILVFQRLFFPMPIGAVASGAIFGLIGALGAVGIGLIWRANRIVNFAQGDLGVFPATLAVLLVVLAGWPWLPSVLIGILCALLVGVLADLLVIRRFFRAPRLMLTVATFGLSQILSFGALILPRAWGEGPEIRTIEAPFDFSLSFGGVIFDGNDLIAVVVAPLVLLAVGFMLHFTETGVALRASAERSDRALMLGIPVRRLEVLVWTVATMMSFTSVLLAAGVSGLPFGLGAGLGVVLSALTALVLGRMTDLGTMALSAVAIGVLISGIRWNTGEEYLVAPILAAIIVVALLFQRRGSTRADREDSSSWQVGDQVRPIPIEIRRIPEVRIVRVVVPLVVLAAVVVIPQFMGTNGQLKAGVVVIFGIIGMSVVVLTGWAGQVSLGQMAFVGVGAAIGAATMEGWGWDPFLAMLVAGPAGAMVAVVVGLPALRLRGLYLAMTTLALSLAASSWLFSNRIGKWIPDGAFPRPDLLGVISLDSPLRLYYFALVVFVVVAWIVRGISRSRTGRVLRALRDNEANVMAFGVNPTRAKLVAFAVSGWVAAIAGVLFVYHQAAFRAVSYSAYESVNVFVSTVIGGLGALAGGPIGALFTHGAQWLLPAPWSFLVVGVGVILVLTSLPGGLGGMFWSLRDQYLRSAARRHGVVSMALDRTSDSPIAPPEALHTEEILGSTDTSDPTPPPDGTADRDPGATAPAADVVESKS